MMPLTAFQRALLEAVQKRYESVLNAQNAAARDPPADCCLWIDRVGGAVSLTEKDGFLCFTCTSAEHRTAVLRTLQAQGYKVVP